MLSLEGGGVFLNFTRFSSGRGSKMSIILSLWFMDAPFHHFQKKSNSKMENWFFVYKNIYYKSWKVHVFERHFNFKTMHEKYFWWMVINLFKTWMTRELLNAIYKPFQLYSWTMTWYFSLIWYFNGT